MIISQWILKMAGWRLDITVPDHPKCIICVAPHTSNWDFILGKLAYNAIGRKASFLMKEQWFFFPLGLIFKAMGGIPVPRKRGSALTDEIVRLMNKSQRLTIAITPEGTRSRTDKWRRGFLFIARNADIPILLGVIDYGEKIIRIRDTFRATGDVDSDMLTIKNYYRKAIARYPENFSTD